MRADWPDGGPGILFDLLQVGTHASGTRPTNKWRRGYPARLAIPRRRRYRAIQRWSQRAYWWNQLMVATHAASAWVAL